MTPNQGRQAPIDHPVPESRITDPMERARTEVSSLKATLDCPDSSDMQVEEALDKLATGLSTSLTEDLLRQTRVGLTVNALTKSRAHGNATRNKALALVAAWKELVVAERRTRDRVIVAGGSTSDSASGQRGELEVVTVTMAKAAQRRIVRHATAARDQNMTRALFVEECIDLNDDASDLD